MARAASTSTTSTTTRSPTTPGCSDPSRWRRWTASTGPCATSPGWPSVAPRRYRIVVLSDHGQSQGAVFADRYGETLADVCAGLMDEHVRVRGRGRRGTRAGGLMVGDIGTAGVTGTIATRAGAELGKAQRTPTHGGDGRGARGRAGLRQPRAGLPARAPPPDAGGAGPRLAGARPGPRPAPGRRVRRRRGRRGHAVGGRRGGQAQPGDRGGVRASTRWPPSATTRPGCWPAPCCWRRRPTSTSTAPWTRSPTTSPRSRGWWARTAGSGAGRTRACCSHRRT